MAKINPNLKFGVIWMMPIILIFFAGGLLQYAGLLSQTQSNWLALGLFSHVFLARAGFSQLKYEAIFAIFFLVIIFSHFENSTPTSYTLTYLYYIVCTIIAAVAGRTYASRVATSISTNTFFKFAKTLLLIELGAVLIQKTFTAQFIELSQAPIGYVDAIFGTFFLQSDAGLAAVCELLTISTFLLYCKMTDRLIICALSVLIIFLGNSNAAKATIILLFIPLIAYNLYRGLNASRYGFNAMLALAVTFVALIMYNPLSRILAEFFSQASNDYYSRGTWETAARFSPLGQMITDGISLFGQGALTYYNPITKAWLYNAGFSTIYGLYIDFGLAGLSIYCLYQLILIFRFTRNYLEFMMFVCVAASFMALNFALTDVAFVFSFNGVLYLNYLRGKSKPPQSQATDLNRNSRSHLVRYATR